MGKSHPLAFLVHTYMVLKMVQIYQMVAIHKSLFSFWKSQKLSTYIYISVFESMLCINGPAPTLRVECMHLQWVYV